MTKHRPNATAGHIHGYAVKWDSASGDLGGLTEYIRRGAFTRSLQALADVRALVDHDSGKIIGRSSSGTLRLKEDHVGLHFSCDVADTSAGRDAITSITRRDLQSCSFAFTIADGGERWYRGPDGDTRRELTNLDLLDVSVVVYPAYPQTSVQTGA